MRDGQPHYSSHGHLEPPLFTPQSNYSRWARARARGPRGRGLPAALTALTGLMIVLALAALAPEHLIVLVLDLARGRAMDVLAARSPAPPASRITELPA